MVNRDLRMYGAVTRGGVVAPFCMLLNVRSSRHVHNSGHHVATMVSAEGRRPSFGSGRRPRPYFCPKHTILIFFDDVQPPEDDFWRIFGGSSEIIDVGYVDMFYNSWGTLRNPAKSRCLLFSFNIHGFWVL